jgi:hypothetical protein
VKALPIAEILGSDPDRLNRFDLFAPFCGSLRVLRFTLA